MARTPRSAPAAPPGPSFELALQRLEEIVRRIETEELELDESLALFEEGIGLLRRAESIIGSAELRVQQLISDGNDLRVEPFAEDQ